MDGFERGGLVEGIPHGVSEAVEADQEPGTSWETQFLDD